MTIRFGEVSKLFAKMSSFDLWATIKQNGTSSERCIIDKNKALLHTKPKVGEVDSD